MEEAIKYFLTIHNQIKLMHWTTSSYASHKALDELHDNMGSLIDQFVEVYIGHHNKNHQNIKPFKVKLELSSDASPAKVHKFLETHRDNLTEMVTSYKNAPGFENILSEMIALFDNTIYLTNLR